MLLVGETMRIVEEPRAVRPRRASVVRVEIATTPKLRPRLREPCSALCVKDFMRTYALARMGWPSRTLRTLPRLWPRVVIGSMVISVMGKGTSPSTTVNNGLLKTLVSPRLGLSPQRVRAKVAEVGIMAKG